MVSLSAINGDAVTGLHKSQLSRLRQGTAVESEILLLGCVSLFVPAHVLEETRFHVPVFSVILHVILTKRDGKFISEY